jgi:hypothetical protein
MASKSRRKVGSGENEQAEYLKAKITDTEKLVEALRLGISDITEKLKQQMEAMGASPLSASRRSPLASRLSPLASRLSPLASRLSPLARGADASQCHRQSGPEV